MILWLNFSVFVSWMKTRFGLWRFIMFLKVLFFTLAPRPLIFHESTIIKREWIERVGVGFMVGLLPNHVFAGPRWTPFVSEGWT